MAKGDKQKHQNQMDTQQKAWDSSMGDTRNTLTGTQNKFMGNYDTGVGKNFGSYDQIMNNYQDLYNNAGSGGGYGGDQRFGHGSYTPQTYDYTDPFNSYGGYSEFSKTGGFSEADKQNMRERNIAPTRSIYDSAQRGIDKQRALQGGYSPNYTAAKAKSARDMSQQISDINVASNAGIAEMVQKGRLAGLGGMSNIEGQRLGAEIDKNKFAALQKNWAEEQTGADRRFGASMYEDPMKYKLAALQGMTGLYGTTPAMAQLFGDQVLKNQSQILTGQEMQGGWGQNQINNQYQNAQIPSTFQNVMSNIGTGLKYAGQIGAAVGTGGASLALPGGGLYGPGGIIGGGNKGAQAGGGQLQSYGQNVGPYVNPGGSTNWQNSRNIWF